MNKQLELFKMVTRLFHCPKLQGQHNWVRRWGLHLLNHFTVNHLTHQVLPTPWWFTTGPISPAIRKPCENGCSCHLDAAYCTVIWLVNRVTPQIGHNMTQLCNYLILFRTKKQTMLAWKDQLKDFRKYGGGRGHFPRQDMITFAYWFITPARMAIGAYSPYGFLDSMLFATIVPPAACLLERDRLSHGTCLSF